VGTKSATDPVRARGRDRLPVAANMSAVINESIVIIEDRIMMIDESIETDTIAVIAKGTTPNATVDAVATTSLAAAAVVIAAVFLQAGKIELTYF